MGVLIDNEINEAIKKLSVHSNNSVYILSAFCKKNAFNNLAYNINPKIKCKKLLIRFLLSDIISGASDLEVYNATKEQGWELYINFNLHAKIYIFDEKYCILGSSNLTSKGLNLIENGNIEAANLFNIDNNDFNKIVNLFNNSIRINDLIYSNMKEQLNTVEINGRQFNYWKSSIFDSYYQGITVLFTQDFPSKDVNMDEYNSLTNFEHEQLKKELKTSNAYFWLYNYLRSKPNQEAYFGELASELHDILIIEPRAFRKDVKAYIKLLLEWVSILCEDDMVVDIPNHSTRVRLI